MDPLEAVGRAIDQIEDRLLERLSVREIAEASGFSPWYFQRVFRAVVGESLGCYIRRRRLGRSIEALLETDQRILDIALEHGFESQEAYTRAFRAVFRLPPGRFRARGQRVSALTLPRRLEERLAHRKRLQSLEPRIVDRDAAWAVGVQGRFLTALSPETDNAAVIPELWSRFRARRHEISGAIGAHDYGIIAPPEDEKRRGLFLYTAGTRVGRPDALPQGLSGRELPSGRYAVFEHRASQMSMPQTVVHALVSWLPQSGYQYRQGPEIERYPQHFDPRASDVGAEYWVPVREGSGA